MFLVLHLNPLQKASKAPPYRIPVLRFAAENRGVLQGLSVPVIAKEVGWEFRKDGPTLAEAG